jgi:hypothetical protein|tara:strand:+ start:112 stop:360 length:249 start_codon:yes stop_codon:yes gene_type:complete
MTNTPPLILNNLEFSKTNVSKDIYYCPEKDRFAFIQNEEILEMGTLDACLEEEQEAYTMKELNKLKPNSSVETIIAWTRGQI